MSGGGISARESGRARVSRSLEYLKNVATASDPVIADKRQYAGIVKEQTMCRYMNRESANGAVGVLCPGPEPTVEDQERAQVGNLNAKWTLDEDDLVAVNAAAQTMFLSNRPSAYTPVVTTEDEGRLATVMDRSVNARELQSLYCFMKTYEHRMGGDASQMQYIRAYLNGRGITSLADIQSVVGNTPSLYAQKKVMVMAANDPEAGVALMDTKENTARVSNVIKSYGISAKHDMLEVLQCNQVMASQMMVDALLPRGYDLQEQINSLRIASDSRGDTNVVDVEMLNERGGM